MWSCWPKGLSSSYPREERSYESTECFPTGEYYIPLTCLLPFSGISSFPPPSHIRPRLTNANSIYCFAGTKNKIKNMRNCNINLISIDNRRKYIWLLIHCSRWVFYFTYLYILYTELFRPKLKCRLLKKNLECLISKI